MAFSDINRTVSDLTYHMKARFVKKDLFRRELSSRKAAGKAERSSAFPVRRDSDTNYVLNHRFGMPVKTI
jgi:hypothetical protein